MSYSEVSTDIDELKFLLSQSKRASVRAMLEGELTKRSDVLKTLAPTAKKPIVKKTGQTKKISNYAWNDAGMSVKIFVTGIKEEGDVIEKDNIEISFETRSFRLFLRKVGPKGVNYSLNIGNLCKEINTETSSVKQTKTGVTVILKKVSASVWGSLKATAEEKKEEAMPKMDKDADPSAGVMNLMKQMYETGDDEMKQQIAKSMYESQQKQKAGEEPSMPDVNGMGGMGGMGAKGGMPDMSAMMAGMGGTGAKGGMPDMSALMAGMGGMGDKGAGGMPDMSAMMAGMAGMDGMPDMSAFAGMGGMGDTSAKK